MSLTTHVPRLVNDHEVRRRHRSLNFSVPARFPVDGVFAGAYGFFVDVILAVLFQRFWVIADWFLLRRRCRFRKTQSR